MRIPKLSAVAAVCLIAASAQAADGTFTSEAAFVAASSGAWIESFETLAGRSRVASPIVAPLFTITTAGAPIGVQTAANAPDDGFGAAATDGVQYVSVYLPGLAPGSITFTLNGPSVAFGLNITDVGEANGTVSLSTNAGAYLAGVTLLSFPPTLDSGAVSFVGLTQDTPFTQVTLTVTGVDEAYGVDKVYVQASPVPEPAAALTLLAGLVALHAWAARRQSRPCTPLSTPTRRAANKRSAASTSV